MRREPDYFQDQELELIYIARKLDEALELEQLLTTAEVDYLVEVDTYSGGVLFRNARAGAFFYVQPADRAHAVERMKSQRWRPYEPGE